MKRIFLVLFLFCTLNSAYAFDNLKEYNLVDEEVNSFNIHRHSIRPVGENKYIAEIYIYTNEVSATPRIIANCSTNTITVTDYKSFPDKIFAVRFSGYDKDKYVKNIETKKFAPKIADKICKIANSSEYKEFVSNPDWDGFGFLLNLHIIQLWASPKEFNPEKLRVEFEIDKNGKVISTKLINSSGDKEVDESFIENLWAFSPYTPLPWQSNLKSKKFTADLSKSNVYYGKRKVLNKELLYPNITIKLLDALPIKEPAEILKGKNSYGKAVEIKYSPLKLKYGNEYAINYVKDKTPYILINEKYKGESLSDAISGIIASLALNVDDNTTSINKEIYKAMLEAFVWKAYIWSKTMYFASYSTIEKREVKFASLLNQSPKDGKYLIEYITKNCKNLPQESNGYSNSELQAKTERLLKLYNKMLDGNFNGF